MMRGISLQAPPAGAADPASERAPASPTGTPFRAVLRAAGKSDETTASAGDGAPAQLAGQVAGAQALAAAKLGTISGGPGAPPGTTSPPIGGPDFIAHSLAMCVALGVPGGLARDAVPGGASAVVTAGQGIAARAATTGAITPAAQQQPAVGPHEDSPVAAWLAAAVGRAVGSFGGTTGRRGAATDATTPAIAAAATTGATTAAPPVEAPAEALTPLEQAVHELIGQLTERDPARPRAARSPAASPASAATAELSALHALASPHAPAAPGREVASEPARAAAPLPAPEPPANPSHVHLVLEDGPERVVVTVAVRGSDVHVVLRAGDDVTTAALARNAASLDHAMRARGLALGELTTEREPHDQPPPRDPDPRERPAPDTEPFELEDKP